MIAERLALRGQAVFPARRHRDVGGVLPARPAVAGRRRLGELLHQSVLMQLMLAMALVSFAALIYLNQASNVSVLQFSITDLQRQNVELQIENANLYASATSLSSPQRIQSLATSQLHMTKPPYGSIIWIKPVVPAVPEPAPDSSLAARQQSQPLAWMRHVIHLVGSAL